MVQLRFVETYSSHAQTRVAAPRLQYRLNGTKPITGERYRTEWIDVPTVLVDENDKEIQCTNTSRDLPRQKK
jgi:hypothetical protein